MKKKNRSFVLFFDRLLSQSLGKQMLILVGIIVVLFGVSFTILHTIDDTWIEYCDKNCIDHWLFPLYLLIDANAFNNLYSNGDVIINKYTLLVSGITYILGVFLFTGALISILTNVISRRVEKHSDGLIHYLKSGHYIIMGYDDMVSSIINDIFKRDSKAYVLILSAVDAKVIHEKLRKSFTEKTIKHIIINYGLRTSKDFYKDIHLESAEEIFIVGNRALQTHDAMNIECVDSICAYLQMHTSKQTPKRITCLFEDLDTYKAFKTSEIFNDVKRLGIEFVPYNFFITWAKHILLTNQYQGKSGLTIQYPSIYGNGITANDDKYVHIIFVGMSYFSVAFAMEAAQLLHFPNFEQKGIRTRITFIDKKADEEMPIFLTRNRHFFEIQSYIYRDLTLDSNNNDRITRLPFGGLMQTDFLDTEFEFIKGDVFSAKVQDELRTWSNEREKQYLSIFLALGNPAENFIMGMNMPDEIYDNEIPIFIRQDQSENFISHLRIAEISREKDKVNEYGLTHHQVIQGVLQSQPRKERYAFIYPFGMKDLPFSYDTNSYKMAKLINFLYNTADYATLRFLDFTVLATMGSDNIWQMAENYWNQLSIALKWSNLYCAYNISIKMDCLRSIRGLSPTDKTHDFDELTPNEMEIMAKVEHNRWNIEKLLMGFRKATYDEDKYEHPEHSILQRNKYLFIHHDIRPW